MKPILSIFICVLFLTPCRAQYYVPFDYGFLPSLGISFQGHVNGEVGVMYGINSLNHGATKALYRDSPALYPKFATEFYADNNVFYLGPKLCGEFQWKFICARANIIDYTDFKTSDLRFTPEIGISLRDSRSFLSLFGDFMDVISVTYGYNVPIGNSRIDNIPGNRLTITINFLTTYEN